MRQNQNRGGENNNPNHDSVFEQLVVNSAEDSAERLIGMIAYAEWKLDEPNASPSPLIERKRKNTFSKQKRYFWIILKNI